MTNGTTTRSDFNNERDILCPSGPSLCWRNLRSPLPKRSARAGRLEGRRFVGNPVVADRQPSHGDDSSTTIMVGRSLARPARTSSTVCSIDSAIRPSQPIDRASSTKSGLGPVTPTRSIPRAAVAAELDLGRIAFLVIPGLLPLSQGLIGPTLVAMVFIGIATEQRREPAPSPTPASTSSGHHLDPTRPTTAVPLPTTQQRK